MFSNMNSKMTNLGGDALRTYANIKSLGIQKDAINNQLDNAKQSMELDKVGMDQKLDREKTALQNKDIQEKDALNKQHTAAMMDNINTFQNAIFQQKVQY